jgi:hypothetical protein
MVLLVDLPQAFSTYFERGQNLCPIHWIRKSFSLVQAECKIAIQKDHSRGMMEPKCVTPAALHRAASPLILATTTIGMVESLTENPRIALVPNFPRGEHDEWREGCPSRAIDEDEA